MRDRERRLRNDPPLPRLVFGLTIAAAGALFWLDRIGRLDAGDWLQWWPLAALAMSAAHLVHRRWAGAVVWGLIGCYFLLPLVGLPRLHFWRILGLWPLLVSAGGVMLILHALRGSERSFAAHAVMAGNVQKVGGRFRGGEAVAVMGGCVVDLTNATIAGEAVFDVISFWGGVELIVPRGWKVINNVLGLLGGLSMKVDPAPDDAPRLIVRGGGIMGGVDVHHPKERV